MTTNHTVEMLLAAGERQLRASSESPRLDAELLLAHVLGVGRAWLLAHGRDVIDAPQYTSLLRRRAVGEPMAYLVGFKDFWTLRIRVTPAVLIPRPETELLVERVLALGRSVDSSVLDLGTGSGAIALAIASERRRWKVAAIDASAEALAVARANAMELGLADIEFLAGSWLEPVAGRRFDIVVSNPPYIAEDDAALLHPALRCEPRAALSPGGNGMAALQAIIDEAPKHLLPDGWLLLEHGATQAGDVAGKLVARGFHHVTSHSDLAGLPRVTEAQWRDIS